MNDELRQIETELHASLRAAVDEATYRIWLAPLRVVGRDDRRLLLSAPRGVDRWLTERFGDVLRSCACAAAREQLAVAFAADERADTDRQGSPQLARGSVTAAVARAVDGPAGEIPPNPRLTFDHFVIGECNRLAHSAALTVAEMPGESFNPLFICGPPGVGKTHLLHSIAIFLSAHSPGTVVRLIAGESFTNDFLTALQQNRLGEFKARFRRADVLLLDDVQFLQSKTRTEEEFFHTFNALYEVGAQLVLTSDRPPRDLRGMEDRLRERFEAGLVAEVSSPDPVTRASIVNKKIHDQRIELADRSVAELVAERVTASVRALEGALVRIVAFASLSGREVTHALAEEVLNALYPEPASGVPTRSADVAAIQEATCAHFELTRPALLSSSRASRLVWARQVAMYLTRDLTGESLPSIGRMFGGRDHSTVLHACRRAQLRLAADEEARCDVEEIRAAVLRRRGGVDRRGST